MARKKRRAPNMFEKKIAGMYLWLARFFLCHANVLTARDENPPVPRAMIKKAQKKWGWRKDQTLTLLRGVYKRHAMLDVFQASYEGDDLHRKIISSVYDIVLSIDTIRREYDTTVISCQTLEEFEKINFDMETHYAEIYGDVMQQIDAYQEYLEKRLASERFVIEVKSYLKDARAFLRCDIIFDSSERTRLVKLLSGILNDWMHTQEIDTIERFSLFYHSIERRKLLIERLWEQIVPQKFVRYDEYSTRHDEWYQEPYVARSRESKDD